MGVRTAETIKASVSLKDTAVEKDLRERDEEEEDGTILLERVRAERSEKERRKEEEEEEEEDMVWFRSVVSKCRFEL